MQTNEEIAIDICYRLGYDNASILGHGTYGYAFDIGNGKVLKLTVNEKEFQAALMQLRTPELDECFAHVFTAFLLPLEEFKFAIVLEKLDTERNREGIKQFNKDFLRSCHSNPILSPSITDVISRAELQKIFIDKDDRKRNIIIAMCLELMRKHEISDGERLLDAVIAAYIKLGILCPGLEIDFQANNIAYDMKGNVKLFDLRQLS